MALLLRTLFVLSLLFVSGFAQLLPFPFFPHLPFPGQHVVDPDPFPGQKVDETEPFNGPNVGGADHGVSIDAPKGAEQAGLLKTLYKGGWELFSKDSGVSAMHSILLPNNKVVMYDATIFEISNMKLPPGVPCRIVDQKTGKQDCWCHAIMFDIETGAKTALQLHTDTWCSSGALDVNGNLVGTGGDKTGSRTVRYLHACDTCDWKEDKDALKDARWYATTVTLGDGSFVIFGGRGVFTYEYIPPEGQYNSKSFYFPFLRETFDPVENNLYPFVHLNTDGNLFIFANNKSILFNAKDNKIIRNYPDLPGGARNYPASGMSALLPITLFADENRKLIPAEILVCGGSTHDAYFLAEKQKFVPALDDCARIQINSAKAKWKKEIMPSPRVMGDMIILPTGDVLMLNGAKKGSAGWGYAQEPNLNPVLYKPKAKRVNRFEVLAATTIPRMYHASSALLPDGRVLVAGSNTNSGYKFNVQFPTELRVEKFSPPYLDPAFAANRPQIVVEASKTRFTYGEGFVVQIRSIAPTVTKNDVKVTMYSPAFTTHGISMNQRLLICGITDVISNVLPGLHNIIAVAPPTGNVAPQGFYLLYVVYRGIPSTGVWVQIK